ncbi:MAG: glycosyltransferase family 4 protein [Bacteroidetes bacterium]|nr:glycosyltransferase family 4 protein [Bacteroidota bacterium]
MKVALVHWRLAHVGGLENRLRLYTEYFHQRGDQITIFCYKQSPNFHLHPGVKVVQLALGIMPKPFRFWYFNHLLRKHFVPSQFDFSLSLQRTGQQVACLAPGDHLGFLKAQGRSPRNLSDLLQIHLDRDSYRASKVIYPCSEMVAHNLETLYGVPRNKMVVLPPPLATDRFNRNLWPERQALRRHYGMSEQKTTFVIVSTAHRRKGIPLLLKVFSLLKDQPVELKIAGAPLDLPHLPNITYLGYEPCTERLFTAADYTIHPAVYEPFGQVISESLACGAPVLLSAHTGWGSNLPTGYGRIVSGFEPVVWAQAVVDMVKERFSIPTDFAQIHGLTLRQHMDRMLAHYPF